MGMDFQNWMNQWVWVSDSEKLRRREYIPYFKKELEAWMKERGYEMDGYWKNQNVVSRWLYAIHVVEIVKKDRIGGIEYAEPNHRNWPEDRDTYEVHVMQDDIDSFLDKWETNEDFDKETRVGQRVREDCLRFLYIFLDLDASKRGKEISRIMLDTDDEEEDEKGDKDMYLVDAQEGWHGGGWQKV
jgi:hypothetical protein